MTAEAVRCGVCGVAAQAELLTYCFRCRVAFHLNPYSDRPGIDCGDAVLGAVELGVYYYCEPCLVILNDEALAVERGDAPSRVPSFAPPPPPPAVAPPPRAALGDRAARRRRFRRVDS